MDRRMNWWKDGQIHLMRCSLNSPKNIEGNFRGWRSDQKKTLIIIREETTQIIESSGHRPKRARCPKSGDEKVKGAEMGATWYSEHDFDQVKRGEGAKKGKKGLCFRPLPAKDGMMWTPVHYFGMRRIACHWDQALGFATHWKLDEKIHIDPWDWESTSKRASERVSNRVNDQAHKVSSAE